MNQIKRDLDNRTVFLRRAEAFILVGRVLKPAVAAAAERHNR